MIRALLVLLAFFVSVPSAAVIFIRTTASVEGDITIYDTLDKSDYACLSFNVTSGGVFDCTGITLSSGATKLIGFVGYENIGNFDFGDQTMIWDQGGTPQPMTRLDGLEDSGGCAIFYLDSPNTGVSKTLRLDPTGSAIPTTGMEVMLWSISGGATGAGESTVTGVAGFSTGGTVSLAHTGLSANAMTFSGWFARFDDTGAGFTVGTGQTQDGNPEQSATSDREAIFSHEQHASGGNQTQEASWTSPNMKMVGCSTAIAVAS